MEKPENVIMHFENNNTSENHELCAKCNGACCRHYAGAYGPWQLFDNPEDITPEAIANLLQQDEKYILDCYEGYSDEHPDGWFIRPPHKKRVTWETLQLYMNVLGVVYERIYVDRSFGGECIHFVDGIGCKLAYDKRPVMCQALVAEENCRCAGFDKKDAADWWSEYHHIIDKALESLAQ